jgi:DNA-cytosine methyltransferase
MNHFDLYSGAGCFAIAAEYVWSDEYNLHSFVECDPFAQKWLKANWPGCKIHDNAETYKNDGTTIDLLTGGPPCQPVSCAGKQQGQADDRWQWPTMFRIIQDVKPRFIIFENVYNLVNFDSGILFDGILSDMESAGYETATFVLPACSQDAPHLRKRVFVVGISERSRIAQPEGGIENERRRVVNSGESDLGYSNSIRFQVHRDRTGLRRQKTFRFTSQSYLADIKEQSKREPKHQEPTESWQNSRLHHSGFSAGNRKSNLVDTLNTRSQDRRSESEKTNPRWGNENNGSETTEFCQLWQDHEWITGHDGKARRVPIPRICRVAYGDTYGDDKDDFEISAELLVKKFPNRNDLLRLFGNAIVWPVVVPIMQAIKEVDRLNERNENP